MGEVGVHLDQHLVARVEALGEPGLVGGTETLLLRPPQHRDAAVLAGRRPRRGRPVPSGLLSSTTRTSADGHHRRAPAPGRRRCSPPPGTSGSQRACAHRPYLRRQVACRSTREPTIFALPTVRSSDARAARPGTHGPERRGRVVPAVHHGPGPGLPGHPGRRPLRRADRLRRHRPAVHRGLRRGQGRASARSSVRSSPPAAWPSSRSWSSGPWPSGAPSRTELNERILRRNWLAQRPFLAESPAGRSGSPRSRGSRPASSTSRWVIRRTTPGAIVPASTPSAAEVADERGRVGRR